MPSHIHHQVLMYIYIVIIYNAKCCILLETNKQFWKRKINKPKKNTDNTKWKKQKRNKLRQSALYLFLFRFCLILFVFFSAFFSKETCWFGIPESPKEKKKQKRNKKKQIQSILAQFVSFLFFILYFVVVCFYLVCFLLFIVNTHIWSSQWMNVFWCLKYMGLITAVN